LLPGKASRTAQHNALFRALEQRLREPLFHDPWAGRFLRGRYRLVNLLPARPLARLIDRRWPGPRAAVAVRTRFIDDAVESELAAGGVEQVVLLGAGFDSRAYRLDALRRVTVFEVDHPDTQHAKRAVVGDALRGAREVRYAAMRFGHDRLEETLAVAGFDPRRPALFLWEGVTNYLDEAAVDATLRFVAGAGKALIFTYVDQRVLDAPVGHAGAAESIDYVRKVGEPFTYGLDPRGLAEHLAARGLELVEDVALSEAARLYYRGPMPPVSTYYHVARARCRA
jgi:methyltransferase (TIGR00027 family)